MWLKTGRGRDTFIDGFLASVDSCYADVLQGLEAWSAKPPRMRDQADVVELAKDQEVTPALVSTALSPQDGPALAAGAGPSGP